MTFYETLDSIMKQDFGGRGLLASLPASPLAAVSASLAHAKRAVLLTFRNCQPRSSADGSWLRRVSRNRLVFLSASGSGSPLPRSAGNLDPSAGTEYG